MKKILKYILKRLKLTVKKNSIYLFENTKNKNEKF